MKKLVQVVEVLAKSYLTDEEAKTYFEATPEEIAGEIETIKYNAIREYDGFDDVVVTVSIEEIEEEDE